MAQGPCLHNFWVCASLFVLAPLLSVAASAQAGKGVIQREHQQRLVERPEPKADLAVVQSLRGGTRGHHAVLLRSSSDISVRKKSKSHVDGGHHSLEQRNHSMTGAERLVSELWRPGSQASSSSAFLRWVGILFSMILWVVVISATAYFYQERKLKNGVLLPGSDALDREDLQEWKYGVFDFGSLKGPELCLWSCCCPSIRWADTISSLGFLHFWLAFMVFLGLTVIGHLSDWAVSDLLPWLLLTVVGTGFRQEIRSFFKIRQGGDTLLTDFCLYACCTPCAILQEARQVEEIREKLIQPQRIGSDVTFEPTPAESLPDDEPAPAAAAASSPASQDEAAPCGLVTITSKPG